MTSRPTLSGSPIPLVSPEQESVYAEFGVPDSLPLFSGLFGRDELVDVRDISMEQIRKMIRVDGQARSILRVMSLPLRTAPLSFRPTEGEGSDGEEEREFLEDVFTLPPHRGGMTTPMSMVLAHFSRALADGFAVFEKVWQVGPEGNITLRKLAPREATTISFILDDNGGLKAVRQVANWKGRRVDVEIPAEKILVWTAQHEANAWYGESYLEPAYSHYVTKQKLYVLANMGYAFHAVPGRLGTVPANASAAEKRNFREQLARMATNTAMTMPQGWLVEEFGGKGSMPDFLKMIDHHDGLMAKSVLANFLQLATGTDSGSWALSKDQSDLFTLALETILEEWSNAFTFYAVPQLVDFNFTSRAYPDLSIGPLSDATKELMREVFTEIVDAASVQVSREFLFEIERKVGEELGLEIDYDAMRERMEEEAEMEAAVAKATAEAMIENGGQLAPPNEDPAEGAPAPAAVAASEVISLSKRIREGMSARREG